VSTDREYLTAAIPEAVQVFGILLRPFSLGHHLILSRFESPIVCGGEAGIDDVLFAVWVCGHTYEPALESLATGRVWSELKRWKRIMRRRQWYGLRPMKLPQFIKSSQLFNEYVAAARKTPNLFSGEGGAEIGSPTMQVMRVTLQRELHLSDTEILNRPLSQCWWDLATLVELNRKGKVIDRDQFEDMKRKADEFHEKFMAERRQ
jgi:hypothetical protein